MNCTKYLDLLPKDKVEFIGRVVHAIQSDEQCFDLAQKMVKAAAKKGIFEGVTINPAQPEEDIINSV